MTAVANKQKLEEEKPDGVWNPKKRKWTKPASQIGYKAFNSTEYVYRHERRSKQDFRF